MIKKLIFALSFGLMTITSTKSQSGVSMDSLNREYISAQIKNQTSQAEYYAKQSRNINSQWFTLIGALAGSIIGLLGAYMIARINKSGEIKKLENQLQEDRTINMKLAASDLMKKVAEGFHSLTWVLWIAKNTPNDCSQKIIEEHDKRMNKIYSEIAGAQVVLSAYNKKIYEDTKSIVGHLYHCDGELGRTAYGLKDPATKSKAIEDLGNMWKDIYDYSLAIPKTFADSLELAIPQKTNASR